MPTPNSNALPGSGIVMALLCRVTAVCAYRLPFKDAPVWAAISVAVSKIPSKCEYVPSVAPSAVCQKMFWACAPPLRKMLASFAKLRRFCIWKIQTAFESPLIVIEFVIVTALSHLYRPGAIVCPLRSPPDRFRKSSHFHPKN